MILKIKKLFKRMEIHKHNKTDDQILKDDKKYLKFITLTSEDIWGDLGSHIGGFVLNIHDKVKRVIAIEADRNNFQLLEKNLKINHIKNVKAKNLAVIHTDEKTQKFYLNPGENTGMHSLLVKRGREEVLVKSININTLIEKYQINKLKIDIEGSEFEILRHITDKNYQNLNEIIFEFHFKILGDKTMEKYYKTIGLLERYFSTVDYQKTIAWTKLVYCKK